MTIISIFVVICRHEKAIRGVLIGLLPRSLYYFACCSSKSDHRIHYIYPFLYHFMGNYRTMNQQYLQTSNDTSYERLFVVKLIAYAGSKQWATQVFDLRFF